MALFLSNVLMAQGLTVLYYAESTLAQFIKHAAHIIQIYNTYSLPPGGLEWHVCECAGNTTVLLIAEALSNM